MDTESAESRSVNISIISKNAEQGRVSAVVVANVFQSIQKLIYNIVDYLEGRPVRSKGDFPKGTKEIGELLISEICIGSISAGLNLVEQQSALPGMPTFGERAISVTNNIVHALLSEDISEENIESKMVEIVQDKDRIRKILEEIEILWPDKSSKYLISLGFGTQELSDLNPDLKPIVTSFLHRPPEFREEAIFGRLTEFRVDQKRKFQVDTPNGIVNCQYNPEIEDYIKEHIGRFIKIHSEVKLDRGVRTLRLDNRDLLEVIHALPLFELKLNGVLFPLREPLLLNVMYENELYICTNNELGLLVVDKNLKEIAEGVNEEMEMLWNIYVRPNMGDLSGDAIKLRKRIVSMFRAEDMNVIV